MLRKEVESNIEIAAEGIKTIPRGDIIHPLFNTSTGDVIQARGLSAGTDVSFQIKIAATYDQLRSINWVNMELYELVHRKSWVGGPCIVPDAHRDWVRIHIVGSCQEAKGDLEDLLKLLQSDVE